MNKLLVSTVLSAALLVCTCTDTMAADNSSVDNLTVEQAINVAAGLRQLHKYDTVDKDGRPAVAYYKFGTTPKDSSDIRITIALDIEVASRIETAFSKANNELIVQMSNGGSDVPKDKMGEYNITVRKMLDAPCRCSIYKIKLADLKLEENPIPSQILSWLVPILDRGQ